MNRSWLQILVASAATLGVSGAVHAQFGGQPGGMGPGMGPGPGEEQKEEGPAEAAPETESERPGDLEPLGGYPGQQRRQLQIIDLDGYLRLRTDFLHNFHLGRGYTEVSGRRYLPYFPQALECGTPEEIEANGCGSNDLAGGNMRLRLEPTINVTDQVRVHTQIDVLDNTILGSTADSILLARRGETAVTNRAPIGVLSTTQDPPEIGRNGWFSSITAKRAWGEVDSELGSLRFGRMPWHFGRGIAFNDGSCADCEGGTTVDRVMGIMRFYGHQVALAWDWGAQGYNLGMLEVGRREGVNAPPLDLSQDDDVFQLMGAVTLLDDERRFRERVEVGELAVNYGFQFVYRRQNAEVFELDDEPGTVTATQMPARKDPEEAIGREDLARSLTRDVDAMVFLPSLWFKLGWKALTIEGEVDAVLGNIDRAGPLGFEPQQQLTLRQLGWVLATELRLYRNSFFLGFETGGATGDEAEDPTAYLNHRWKLVRQQPGDERLGEFKFNPDYQIDQVLYRRIYGTVANSVYVKPSLAYWLDLAETRQVGLSASVIYSMAPVQVSTPGNSLSYGVELDLGITYRNPGDGFFFGAIYGVLWPMGALNRGVIGETNIAPDFERKLDASAAQVFRTFAGIRF